MNKTLRFSLLSLLVMLCGTMFADYQKVTATADITDGEYLIVYEAANVAFNGALETLDAVENTVSVVIADDKIASSDAIDAATFTIDVTAGTLKSASGKYVGVASNSNGLKQTENAETYTNTFSIDESANAVIAAVFDGSTMTLRFNAANGQNRFRYYKSGQQAIQLYKKVAAAPAGPYTVDFDTAINTSAHDFQVASNWSHMVGSGNYDNYGPYYMSYSYYSTSGVDGTGCLSAGRQYAGDNWGGTECTDLLITPEVKGIVTLAVKKSSSSNSYIEFYAVTGSEGAWVQGDQIEYTGDELTTSDWVTVTLNIADFTRIGIRASNCYIDNFTATEANIVPEKKMTIASAEPSATTGTIYWDQQENGKVLVKYTVTVTNSGEVNLTQGMDGYSISIINGSTNDVIVTTPVPQDLAVGATSEPFDVQAEVESSLWANSYSYIKFNLQENLKQSVVQRAQSQYRAYEPKFVFRVAESTSTSSITTAESWGTITESTTKSFEIANTGTAPLTIKSVTLPEGFTSNNAPTAEFTLAKGETKPLNITQDATATGTFTGNLAIVYLDKDGAEQTYTLAFSATIIGENTWTADFNNTTSTVLYPEGTVAEGGINSDYQYVSSGNYNNWLIGRNTSSYKTENNKFITPKLHANAGEKLAFDVKAGYSSSDDYFVKVYVSADRQNWGEPVETYVYSTIGSTFTTKTITFDEAGDYYVAFALYGTGSGIDNIVGLQKVGVAHDLYIKSVSWPDASVKSGTALTKPSVDIIPLTDEAAENYTVKYIYGENEVAIDSKALTASANSSTTFTASFTPVVENTTFFEGTKVVFEFTDGTKFETEPFDLTVTNEAIFHFLNSTPTSKWYEPTDRTAPIAFGKTNATDTQNFVIYNWGSAPLTVNSISLPDGFSTTTEFPLTVAAFDENNLAASSQALDITFSAETAGSYSGNMVITYSGDKTFELPISGTKLDPTLFYANFDDGGWPAGSVYQNNISSSNGGTYSAPNYYITSSSTTNNLFITPKLTAAAGDKLLFDAKLYSNSWSEGKVVVYAAATRDELVNFDPENDTRTPIFSVSGEDETNPMTTDYQTFEVPAVAGDNYYAFEISGRPYVDELYGLKVTEVAHDWMIASSNIPTEAMQNVALKATVNVANFGIADEAADGIQVIAYLDGEAIATAEGVAMPVSHKLDDAGIQMSVTFRSPKVGTFPVYLEVKAGDYSISTAPVAVTFSEEIAVADAIEVGTRTSADRYHGPIDWYNADGSNTRWTDIVYTAEELAAYGITAGSKITSIAFHGNGTAKSMKAKVTSWVGMKTGDITPGTVNKEEMTEISVYDQTDAAATIDFSNTELNLSENPIVYDGTSDIRIYTETVGQGSGNWQTVTYEYDSNYMTSYFNAATVVATPLAYFTLAAEPAVFSGKVVNGQNVGLSGATVTLVSNDGDNVQYTGTSDAEGNFTINVIQANRTYVATASYEGYEDVVETIVFGGESQEYTFVFSVTTGIQQVNAGRLNDGSVYDLRGQKVNGTLKKGIYIINGKKTVIK